jgi:hypothetical protein
MLALRKSGMNTSFAPRLPRTRYGPCSWSSIAVLPPGWSHGEEVTVIGFDHGYVRVLGDGKETTVFIVKIDSGWDEWLMGSGGKELVRGTAIVQGQAESPATPRPQHPASSFCLAPDRRQRVAQLGTRLSNGPETLDGILQRVPRCEMTRPRFRKCTFAQGRNSFNNPPTQSRRGFLYRQYRNARFLPRRCIQGM